MRDSSCSASAAVLERSNVELDQVGACAVGYAEALARHERSQTMASADEVLAARVMLVECLVRTGWLPPPGALRTWTQDLLLLRERDDRDLGEG
jgi:hypothetical protein